MSPDDGAPLDDQLVTWLTAYDEGLARGDAPTADFPNSPPTLQPQTRRLQRCLDLLHTIWPAAAPLDIPWLGERPATFGRFRVRRELGRGGFGIVYLADDPVLRRPVALKVPRPDALADENLRQRFLREARAAASLDHPNVVPVYEAGEVGPVCYIASAYCPGPNLAVWLKQQMTPIPVQDAAAMIAELAGAVHHAHDHGIFHRDLKPSNVLLAPARAKGSSELAYTPMLTDFGLAKLLESEAEQTTTGIILGTPAYMAPEQAEGWSEAVGAATDIYALGVILYELLARRLPCSGPSLLVTLERLRSEQPVPPRRWRPDVPLDLETVCIKCLQKEPRDRYASAAELAGDLFRFGRGEPIRARRSSWLAWMRNWCRAPARLRDAAVVATFNSLVAMPVSLFGVVLVATSILPLADPVLAVLFLSIQTVGGVFDLLAARAALIRKQWGLWLGLITPVFVLGHQMSSAVGWIPTGGLLPATEGSSIWTAQVATLTTLEAVQLAAFALALIAYHANRDRPGFLREASRTPD